MADCYRKRSSPLWIPLPGIETPKQQVAQRGSATLRQLLAAQGTNREPTEQVRVTGATTPSPPAPLPHRGEGGVGLSCGALPQRGEGGVSLSCGALPQRGEGGVGLSCGALPQRGEGGVSLSCGALPQRGEGRVSARTPSGKRVPKGRVTGSFRRSHARPVSWHIDSQGNARYSTFSPMDNPRTQRTSRCYRRAATRETSSGNPAQQQGDLLAGHDILRK